MRSTPHSQRRFGLASIVAVGLLGCLPVSLLARPPKTQAPARQTRPQQPRTAPQKPAPAKSAVKPAEPVTAPAPPPPQDVRLRTVYTNEGMKTETVTFIKGQRERFEFQDMVLLKQHDQKRTIQISLAANTYLVIPEGATAGPMMPAGAGAPPKPPGIITVATTIVDTGERKTIFGQQARRVKTTIDKQPMAGACDETKQKLETDGWYIDPPKSLVSQPAPNDATAPPGQCADQIQATANGDPKALGFPIAYTTTIAGDEGKPVASSMEVSEYELTTLDAALFEIPPGLTAANNMLEWSKALSDANEVKLAAADAEPAASPRPRTPGVIRIGVPEVANKTPQPVNTRSLRQRLVDDLVEAKFEALPMASASPADLQKRAADLGYDYVLLAEVTELKVSKPGKFGGLMSAASGVAGMAGGQGAIAGAAAGAAGAAAGPPKEKTESAVAVKLIQPDGKQRLSTTTKGKDGSGFSLKQGLGLAKFAGGMYLSMFAGPQMFARLNGLGAANLGGMGMLGNPMLNQMQSAGLGGIGKGAGIDQTAGAASYVMQQAMAMNNASGLVGAPGQGPSFDESLGEAVNNAAKAVQKALQKK